MIPPLIVPITILYTLITPLPNKNEIEKLPIIPPIKPNITNKALLLNLKFSGAPTVPDKIPVKLRQKVANKNKEPKRDKVKLILLLTDLFDYYIGNFVIIPVIIP